jgi:hypothetical protein
VGNAVIVSLLLIADEEMGIPPKEPVDRSELK